MGKLDNVSMEELIDKIGFFIRSEDFKIIFRKNTEAIAAAQYIIERYKNNDNKNVTDGENQNSQEEPKTIYDELKKGTDYDLYSDSKVRIRDIAKPYIIPSIISSLIICIYIAIKYKKLHDGKFMITVCETLGQMIIVLLTILSIIAIVRVPFTSTIIPIVIFIMLACLVFKLSILENSLKEIKE